MDDKRKHEIFKARIEAADNMITECHRFLERLYELREEMETCEEGAASYLWEPNALRASVSRAAADLKKTLTKGVKKIYSLE